MHCNDPAVKHGTGTSTVSETGYVLKPLYKRQLSMHCNAPAVKCGIGTGTVSETGSVLKLLYKLWKRKKEKKSLVPVSKMFRNHNAFRLREYGSGKYGSGKSGSALNFVPALNYVHNRHDLSGSVQCGSVKIVHVVQRTVSDGPGGGGSGKSGSGFALIYVPTRLVWYGSVRYRAVKICFVTSRSYRYGSIKSGSGKSLYVTFYYTTRDSKQHTHLNNIILVKFSKIKFSKILSTFKPPLLSFRPWYMSHTKLCLLRLILLADMDGNKWDGYLWVDGWPVTPPRAQHNQQQQEPTTGEPQERGNISTTNCISVNQVTVPQVELDDQSSVSAHSNVTGTSYATYQLSDSEEEPDETQVKLGNSYTQCRAAREVAMSREVTDISCNANVLSTEKKKGFRVGTMVGVWTLTF
jgi:hypothetical protein